MKLTACDGSCTQDAAKRQCGNAVANHRGLPRVKSWIQSNFCRAATRGKPQWLAIRAAALPFCRVLCAGDM